MTVWCSVGGFEPEIYSVSLSIPSNIFTGQVQNRDGGEWWKREKQARVSILKMEEAKDKVGFYSYTYNHYKYMHTAPQCQDH